MDRQEIQLQLNMSYNEQLQYLKKKYGRALENYYLTVACDRKSTRVGRGDEGLFCHHDFEYDPYNPLVQNLSQPEIARQFDYRYQYADNLTYCNYLEHLILHCKINILRKEQLGRYIQDGIVNFFLPILNDLYRYRIKQMPAWQEKAFSLIEDNYDDYCIIIHRWLEELQFDEEIDFPSWKKLTTQRR